MRKLNAKQKKMLTTWAKENNKNGAILDAQEDLQTDIDWLIEQGVDKKEAQPFIKGLLNKQLEEVES